MRTLRQRAFLCILCVVAGCNPFSGLFSLLDPAANSWVLRWNQIAVDTSGLDHTPTKLGEQRDFGHQLGPTRSSRAMAIVHIAMYEAVNAIMMGHESFAGVAPAPTFTSMKAAVAQAAHDTLVSLYPSHKPRLDLLLQDDLVHVPDILSLVAGVALGERCAQAALAMRQNDGSDGTVNYVFSDAPGAWRSDPVNPGQQPLGEEWFNVTPFVLTSGSQFRSPPPPSIDSAEYATAYNDAKQLGGDGITTPTIRTAEQSQIGIYWAYDGTPSLCAPPRLYNQIATKIALDRGINVVDLARLLALVNVAMADAGIAIWDSKYHYNYWRPVTGIRESDPGTGPSGLGDGNAGTIGDPTFVPLGAPGSNSSSPNFTPPFPAYPSGHAGFGGALFQILRNFFGSDDIPFTFVSDELNGVTLDSQGNVRPLVSRSFTTLSEAEEESGQSRIYLGIHWSFDKTEGIALGRKVADQVFNNAFKAKP
jgi:hypothetical protein